LLWNDTRSSTAAAELVEELGGAGEWAKRIGVVPVAAITATKLRWLADREPAHADATAAVCLPHDWLTWRLSGSTDIGTLRTDRSDASGTGYFSSEIDSYQPDLLELAMRGRTTRRDTRRPGRCSAQVPATTPRRRWAWAPVPGIASSPWARPAW
jgi:xylulokinase